MCIVYGLHVRQRIKWMWRQLWVNVSDLRISQLTSQAKSRDRFHALNVPYTALATPFTVRRVVSGHILLACVTWMTTCYRDFGTSTCRTCHAFHFTVSTNAFTLQTFQKQNVVSFGKLLSSPDPYTSWRQFYPIVPFRGFYLNIPTTGWRSRPRSSNNWPDISENFTSCFILFILASVSFRFFPFHYSVPPYWVTWP